MNLLILAAASLAVVGCARLSLKDQEFHAWKLKFGKSYSSPEEEARRKDIWLSTRRRVQAHNILADQGIKTYRMGMNQFSDMDGSCRYDPSEIGTTCTGYIALLPGDESELQSYVAYVGPVSVAVDADDFQHYESGIFYDPYCSSTQINHAVLVVGYGTERGQDYWLVKNSWGEAWGEHGYIRMSRNQDNQCGIASYASYPLV